VSDGDGGAIRSGRGRLVLEDVHVGSSVADGHGGGVSVNAGTAELLEVTFDGNAGGTGGGLSAVDSRVTIAASHFTANRAEAGGGAAILFAPGLSITDTRFIQNAAISDGGGLWIQGVGATDATLPTLGVTNCTFTDNDGGERGGGVAITHLGAPQGDGDITIGSSTFNGNVAERGGGIDTDPDLTTIQGCIFEANRATHDRGGAVAAVGPLSVITSTFRDNRAAGNGGAVHSSDAATILGSTFSGNASAAFGGAIAATGPTTVDASTFTQNAGDDNGGALAFSGTDVVVLTGSTLTDNVSDGGKGGAIYRAAGVLQLGGNVLSGNVPLGDGDGIYLAFGGTLGLASTTTTVPGTCTTNEHCDDGDPCTQGTCASGQCAHSPIGGFAGADCLLAKVLAAGVCGDETVHPKLVKALTKGVGRTRATLAKAEAASGKKQAKLLKKARAQLNGLSRKVQKSKKTPATCRATLAGYLGAGLSTLP
jgi:predicted outer membrane repeat protein